MRRSSRAIPLFSIAASALAHAGVFFGLAYLASSPAREEPLSEVAPGQASAGIGWVENWDAEPVPVLAKLDVTPPPIESFEPLVDRPEREATLDYAAHEEFEISRVDKQINHQTEDPPPPETETTEAPVEVVSDDKSKDEPASPPPDRPGVRGEATILGKLAPHYPRRCRRHGHEGTVLVECLIDTTGIVNSVHVTRSAGCKELDQAAIDALRKTRFEPATENGEAVSTTIRLPIEFRLERIRKTTTNPSTRRRSRH